MKNIQYQWFGRDGAILTDQHGRPMGTIMETVDPRVLAASPGIQSWSQKGATNTPTRREQ